MDSTLSMFQWQAKLVRHAANLLVGYIGSSRPDRLEWKPSVPGSAETRSILELVAECVRVNRRFRALMLGGQGGEVPQLRYRHAEDAVADLKDSAEGLAATIEGLSPEMLDQTFTTGMGPVSGKFLLELPVNNMYYHGGQINLIQILYGDPEFHLPKDFTAL